MVAAAVLALGGAASPRAGAGVAVLEGEALSGGVHVYTVGRGDTLTSIGARFGAALTAIARENRLARTDRLRVGQILAIDNRHAVPPAAPGDALVLNVPQRMLFLYDDRPAAAFPVAIGRPDWPTPLGAFSITEKEIDPQWDIPESIRAELVERGQPAPRQMPPGPDNPLGTRWMRTSFPAVGIHGTPYPASIYRASTHGCIRMHPDDVLTVFARVPEGARGRFVYYPLLVAITPDGVFLEAHPDVYRLEETGAGAAVRAWADARGIAAALDWKAVSAVLEAREGIARRIGGLSHD
jgi:L,D-transpeptidase ErfK/SrfK